jgi:hypothetical protein
MVRYTKPKLDVSILNQSDTDKLFDMVFERIERKKLNKSRIKNEKIVLKVEKEQDTNISDIKDIEDQSQSMLREIQEIGKQLDENLKRQNLVQKNTQQLKEKLEKSSTMDFTSKVENGEIYFSKFEIPEFKDECSTQTESEKTKSSWSSFFNLFRCSN